MPAQVIPCRYWRATDDSGRTASAYGCKPTWPCEMVTDGFSVRWPDGTAGHPRLPRGASESAALAFIAECPGFSGFNAY